MLTEPSLFPELDAPANDRIFFAVMPDRDAAERASRLRRDIARDHGLTGDVVGANRLHITLHHLGDHSAVPGGIVAAAREAAATIALPPFDIAFDRVASFSGKKTLPIVLRGGDGLHALAAFQRALGAAMTKNGLGRWAELSFTPHMTLQYGRNPLAEHSVEPIGWTARSFVLIHSLLGKTEHRLLGEWPLAG